jgi:hypothetical protein
MWDPDTKEVTRTCSIRQIAAPLHRITDVKNNNNNNNSTPVPTGLRITLPSSSPPPEPLPQSPELSSLVPQPEGEDEASIILELDVLQLPEIGKAYDFDGLVEDTLLEDSPHDRPYDSPAEAPHHRDIVANLDKRFIVETKCVRKPSAKAAAVASNININTIPLVVARAFAQALTEAPRTYLKDDTNLPPEPTSHKQAMIHKYKDVWI